MCIDGIGDSLSMTAKTREQSTAAHGAQLPPDEILFGKSTRMAEVRHKAEKISRSNIPVLLHGDGGTGKESLARWIHEHSPYRSGQFVKVNCAAIPGPLLESELFGYERGAFTNAQTAKPGRIEHADNGTLFLDEISDLDIGLQSKLLHFLQDGCFSRIGGETEKAIDARLICATNKNLEEEISAGKFRADLFYRINVVQLHLPALRERKEDIPELAEYLRVQSEKQFAKESEPLPEDFVSYLNNLDWPGNVRELSNMVTRYVLLGMEEAVIAPAAWRTRSATKRETRHETRHGGLKHIAKEEIREMERNAIMEALQANQWNQRKAAQSLKISYRALIYKIRDAGLTRRRSELTAASRGSSLASHSPVD
jgi:transcriptional regulator with PAS, ATPase and Fis domain